MIKELFRDIYRVEIPLQNNPLKALNSYFIKDNERNLIIDTGFNRLECKEAMDYALKEAGFSKENTDIFITHIHADHAGLSGHLAGEETKVYSGKYGADKLMGYSLGMEKYYKDFVIQSGLAEMGVSPDDPGNNPGYKYNSDIVPRVTVIQENDVIQVGRYNFKCVETSGHAPDHMCLYEPEYKILFSGDHILKKITPNNSIWDAPWSVEDDYLGMYLDNLDKIAVLNIQIVFPGHHEVFTDCNLRIKELKAHHHRRLNKLVEIIGDSKMNGAQIAQQLKWDLKNTTWEKFPTTQKFFATGEALSHLTHLVSRKVLTKELDNGVVYYSRVESNKEGVFT